MGTAVAPEYMRRRMADGSSSGRMNSSGACGSGAFFSSAQVVVTWAVGIGPYCKDTLFTLLRVGAQRERRMVASARTPPVSRHPVSPKSNRPLLFVTGCVCATGTRDETDRPPTRPLGIFTARQPPGRWRIESRMYSPVARRRSNRKSVPLTAHWTSAPRGNHRAANAKTAAASLRSATSSLGMDHSSSIGTSIANSRTTPAGCVAEMKVDKSTQPVAHQSPITTSTTADFDSPQVRRPSATST